MKCDQKNAHLMLSVGDVGRLPGARSSCWWDTHPEQQQPAAEPQPAFEGPWAAVLLL